MRKTIFTTEEIYHIYNRGIEKRNIFLQEKDYIRFIHDLFEFNDESPALNSFYRQPQLYTSEMESRKREKIVEVLAFCLMPNHYHLILRQKKNGGITEFMKKVGIGYTIYFNKKNERVGPLFQGIFKAVLVDNGNYFLYLPHYIHLNPLDLAAPEWRRGDVKDPSAALRFLENYRWSSYLDYIGRKNFPFITEKLFLSELLGGEEQYQKDTEKFINELHRKIPDFSEIILE